MIGRQPLDYSQRERGDLRHVLRVRIQYPGICIGALQYLEIMGLGFSEIPDVACETRARFFINVNFKLKNSKFLQLTNTYIQLTAQRLYSEKSTPDKLDLTGVGSPWCFNVHVLSTLLPWLPQEAQGP